MSKQGEIRRAWGVRFALRRLGQESTCNKIKFLSRWKHVSVNRVIIKLTGADRIVADHVTWRSR